MFGYVYKDLDVAHKFDPVPQPSSDYTKHYHDFYEIYFFLQGNVVYTVDEEKRILKPYDLLFIQPGEHHFVTFLDMSPYERYVLKFQNTLVPSFLKEFFLKRSAFYSADENFYDSFKKLDSLFNDYDVQELQLLFFCAITELLIKLSHSDTTEKIAKDNIADNRITAIIQFINKNIRLPITAQDLCKEFHISQSYLYREFQMHMKIPIMKYIRSKKIIAAHQMILSGGKITKVAESFGYIDYTTFYRSFVSVMGFPPSHRDKGSRKKIRL